jgi:hypothetical protein
MVDGGGREFWPFDVMNSIANLLENPAVENSKMGTRISTHYKILYFNLKNYYFLHTFL